MTALAVTFGFLAATSAASSETPMRLVLASIAFLAMALALHLGGRRRR